MQDPVKNLKDYLDVLRENYRDDVKEAIESAVKGGQITEEEAAELLEAY